MENDRRYTIEIADLVGQFRHAVLYGSRDAENLKEAWELYLEIKERNMRPAPTKELELDHIKHTIGRMKSGGLKKHTPTSLSVCYGLRVDLGFYGIDGLMGNLSEKDKKTADEFAKKMSDVLLQKATPLR